MKKDNSIIGKINVEIKLVLLYILALSFGIYQSIYFIMSHGFQDFRLWLSLGFIALTTLVWQVIAQDTKRLVFSEATFDQIYNSVPINIMSADLDGTIVSMNKSSQDTLKKIESLLPIRVDDIVGNSFDVFHQSPMHQRNLLADPSSLPHQAVIELGKEKLDLLVTALYDQKKNYIGPLLTWSVVTEKIEMKKRSEENKDRLETTILSLTNSTGDASCDLQKNISSVVSATEEMVSSIQEISNNTGNAASMTQKTVSDSEVAEELINELQKCSLEIGEILQVVTSIANQTNLLALNATIEAARAGEAGKGFAVVANEVKDLASQTSTATKDISEKITSIQSQTESVLTTISANTSSIRSVNEIVVAIAAAVEEQTAVTNEISKNMCSAESMVGRVSSSVDEIQESVKSNIVLMS